MVDGPFTVDSFDFCWADERMDEMRMMQDDYGMVVVWLKSSYYVSSPGRTNN